MITSLIAFAAGLALGSVPYFRARSDLRKTGALLMAAGGEITQTRAVIQGQRQQIDTLKIQLEDKPAAEKKVAMAELLREGDKKFGAVQKANDPLYVGGYAVTQMAFRDTEPALEFAPTQPFQR